MRLSHQFVSALIVCLLSAVSGNAYDRSTWMADLLKVNPDVRLSQLSIPMAHDAGTWVASSGLAKDQVYNERELFKQGVRAFDMRIAHDNDCPSWMDDLDGDGKPERLGCLRHGNFMWDMIWDLNTFYDEMQYLPTPEELGDECMMLFFQYEGSDENRTESNCKDAINQFVYLLLLRYGEEAFASFSPDLRLDNLKGKIMLFATTELGYVCDYNINGTVPITVVRGGSLSNEAAYENYQTKELQRVFRCDHDSWGLSKNTVYEDAVNMYQDYWDNIDDDNSQNYFARVNINNWNLNKGGFSYAADDNTLFMIGTTDGLNHRMADFLIQSTRPLGLFAFDFCCVDEYKEGTLWGKILCDEVIRHNFIQGRFVKSIKLAKSSTDGNAAQKLLTDRGYELVRMKDGFANLNRDDDGGSHGAYLYMGVKYTNDPDQAIQDLIIVNYGDGSHTNTGFQWNKRMYDQVEGITADGTFDGNLNSGDDGDNIFLFYTNTKEANTDTPIETLSVLTEKESNEVGYLTYDDEWEWNDYGDMNDGSGYSSEYLYLKYTPHTHHFNTDVIHNIANTHSYRCQSCNKSVPVDNLNPSAPTEHSFYYTIVTSPGVHIAKCEYCDYEQYQQCQADSYDEKGYGPCKYCNHAAICQPAEYVDSKYQISNIGQLWWFNNLVTYGAGNSANAVLTKDIALNPDMNASMLYYWEPIGQATNEDYYGVFDGQGHTISGLLCKGEETESVGLFSKLNYATIKNLGVTNSIYRAGGHVGTFAGYASHATLENLYSTANITQTTTGNVNCGGFVGEADNTTFRNGYYTGTLATPNEGETLNPVGNLNSGTVSNVYFPVNECYLCSESAQASESEFALGKVCSSLNANLEDGDTAWGQHLGVDKLPIFSPEGLHYTRSTTTGRYGTICLPSAFTVDGAKVYSASLNDTKDAVILTEVSETVAGTPYIYQATTDEQAFKLTGSVTTTPVASSPLTGVFVSTILPVGSYVMQTQDDVQAFYLVEVDKQPTLSAFKAYLPAPDDAAVKAIRLGLEEDEETGITSYENDNEKQVIYNLAGQRLSKLQKGVNIVGGVKVLVK